MEVLAIPACARRLGGFGRIEKMKTAARQGKCDDSRFTSPNTALSVTMVCDAGGIGYGDALAAVQELHKMKFIRVLVIISGEWNSHYQITPIGRDYIM